MIVKILKAVSGFPGVNYNTSKIDRNKGELMRAANFGPLHALTRLRPQDYINYLQLISGLNSRVSKPQFHAVVSARGKSYDKAGLCAVAEKWLKEMGYGAQPYLIVFHKDTDNNHVHIVTTRVTRDGQKISSAYEKVRAVKSLNKALGYTLGMQYSFSTKAQFYLILESFGYLGKDFDHKKLETKIADHMTDKIRAGAIRDLLATARSDKDFVSMLRADFDLELIFHSAEGKAPYGYTIIDHFTKSVFKGSEVLPLKELLGNPNDQLATPLAERQHTEENRPSVYIGPVRIAVDIDDQAIHGRNRRRKKRR